LPQKRLRKLQRGRGGSDGSDKGEFFEVGACLQTGYRRESNEVRDKRKRKRNSSDSKKTFTDVERETKIKHEEWGL